MSNSNKIITDDEFGEIEIRRVRGVYVRLKVQPNGKIVAQLPRLVPLREVTKLIEKSRPSLRKMLENHQTPALNYDDGAMIGKSHKLSIQRGDQESMKVKGLDIIVTVTPATSAAVKTRLIKDGVTKALRQEAKAYLPRRLKFLAEQHGFAYSQVRFAHAKSRWGSCSSRSTISLNIMLMTLPNELIDYVLLHELNHTKHMNHSREFWVDLERVYPGAKIYKKKLHDFSPFL